MDGRAACAALVLAGGRSARLGQPKQLVRYRGETLLGRIVSHALQVAAGPVLVVLGAPGATSDACRAELAGLPVNLLDNPDAATGMGSSLRLGMAAVTNLPSPPERLLLLVADQPLVTSRHLALLLAVPAPGGIAAAVYAGRAGVPAVFSRQHFAALSKAEGDAGARALLRSLPFAPVPMPEAAVDIDTPEDLRALVG